MSILFSNPFGIANLVGTADDEILVAQEISGLGPDTLSGGGGNDIILGDSDDVTVDQGATNNSIATALLIDDVIHVSSGENPLATVPAAPHMTVVAEGVGITNFYSVTVGAGETLTADLDFGLTGLGLGGSDFDSVIELFDGSGTSLAFNDDAGLDIGSFPAFSGVTITRDSFLTWTNTSTTDQTVYLAVDSFGGGGVPIGASYLMTVSVTNHPFDGAEAYVQDADSINGGDGDDYIIAGGGDDTVSGDAGNDTIHAGTGDDSIDGGADDDTLTYANVAGGVVFTFSNDNSGTVTGAAGTDTYANIETMVGTEFDDVFDTREGTNPAWRVEGGAGDDEFILRGSSTEADRALGGAGDDIFRVADNFFATHADGGIGTDTFDASLVANGLGMELDLIAQTHTFRNPISGVTIDTKDLIGIENLTGTQSADMIKGDALANLLDGQNGDDDIRGDAGNDTILGGAGADTIDGGDDDDLIDPGTGDDDVNGGTGLNTLTYASDAGAIVVAYTSAITGTVTGTQTGTDSFFNFQTLIGTDMGDSFDTQAGAGIDWQIAAGMGDDTITMRAFDDQEERVLGEDGDDTFLMTNFFSGAHVDGGAGTDTFSAAADDSGFGYRLDLIAGVHAIIVSSPPGFLNIRDLIDVENLTGSQSADDIAGDGAANVLSGEDGEDTIFGGAGDDTLLGGLGNDTLNGSDGEDELNGGDGDDVIDGGAGNDIINGGAGDDTIEGGDGDDFIIFGGVVGQRNLILGGAGNDIIGSSGDDTIEGGDGDDLIFANATFFGSEELDGGAGNDTLDAGTTSFDYEVNLATGLTNFAGEIFINFENLFLGAGNDEGFGTTGANRMQGNDGNDRLLGFAGNDTLIGGAGLDTLNGGDGDDSILAGDAADKVFAEAGDDYVDGGAGDDLLEGKIGNDTLIGGAGNDTLRASDGADSVVAGDGDDLAFGGNDNDTLLGGDGNDTLDGSSGNDVIDGQNGNDVIVGETGADTLFGQDGNDTIRGGGGDDLGLGGNGNDTLFGSAGDDILIGEAGDDLIEGNTQSDSLFGELGNDTLRGGDGFDFLNGGADDDILAGGNGQDTLLGHEGVDILRGNAQADTFQFDFVSDSSFGASDLIDGIEGVGVAGGDVIQLTFIDADTGAAGDQGFTFIGESSTAAALLNGAGTLWTENVGAQTYLRGIIDADALVDLEVRIADGAVVASDYTAGDFFL